MSSTTLHPELAHPAESFIAHHLPDWIKRAQAGQIARLQACVKAHLASQTRMAAYASRVQPLDRFAKALLERALADDPHLQLKVDLDQVVWREQLARFVSEDWKLPEYPYRLVPVPALQKLLLNFKAGESFYRETALALASAVSGQPGQVLSNDTDRIVRLCRATDVGAAYQRHLDEVLSDDFAVAVASDKRLELAVAVEIAAMKGQLDATDLQLLRRLGAGQPPDNLGPLRLAFGALSVLGCQVDGALAVELIEPPRTQATFPFGSTDRLKRVILYLPDDQQQPLRHFTNWQKANAVLAHALADKGYRQAFTRRIALHDRVDYQTLLASRLKDPEPDLAPCRVLQKGDGFSLIAQWHIKRIRQDARFLAVPTEQADAAVAAQRLKALENAGLLLLNLAGLFVPAIGTMLLADMARQLLSEVFEGVRDWSQGHRHEALEHMLSVGYTVAATGAVAFGAHWVRSAFVEGLAPVTRADGKARLWSEDLEPYRETSVPKPLVELDNGLLSDGKRHWWRLNEHLYRVGEGKAGVWRLLHRDDPSAFAPVLEHFPERAWRLSYERPLEWQGESLLLGRLWPPARELDGERVAQVLRVADVDEAQLRGLLVEGRRLPVNLRDTLERFAVEARVQKFLSYTGMDGVDDELLKRAVEQLELQEQTLPEQLTEIRLQSAALSEALLEHFSTRYLVADPLQLLIQRDFPGLSDAYALDVLGHASASMRGRMLGESRIPLALAERARATLALQRLTRTREALYLKGSYRAEAMSLAFALLRSNGLAQGDINLIVRQNLYSGPVLARLFPWTEQQELVLLRQDGGFKLYKDNYPDSRPICAPEGIFEVLAACLPPGYLKLQGWNGENAPQLIRQQLQAWLPRQNDALLKLLDWREARPTVSPLRRMPDGRLGYPLGGCQTCIESPERILRRRIRALFPAIDEAGTDRYIQSLLLQPGALYDSLIAIEREYRSLDESLLAWTVAGASESRPMRRQVTEALRRAWQMRGDRAAGIVSDSSMLSLSIVAIPVGSLPALPAGTDFSHVSELSLSGLGLQEMPQGFLACFPLLQRLDMSNNALRELPPGLDRLTGLRQLLLPHNRIHIPATQASVLTGLSNLRSLDLSSNALGAISLQFNQLRSLRILRLNRTGLLALPGGLESCGLLMFADLRNNQIAELPQALYQSPAQLRRALHLEGNALSAADIQRLYEVERLIVTPAPVRHDPARDNWLATLDAAVRDEYLRHWDAVQAEPESGAFFQLLGRLLDTAEFRRFPTELGSRVWTLITAIAGDTSMRNALFDLAAEPATCVDSVATIFSRLEVRMHVEQVDHAGNPLQTRTARLRLAQRLFRVRWVETIALRDIDARYQDGRWSRGDKDEEEVEVNLAYLSGLADRLNLLGQPRHMQFGVLSGVTPAQLDDAYLEVLQVEMTEQRTLFISELDFWLAVLRAESPDAFDELEQRFSTELEALDEQKTGIGSEAYVRKANTIRDARDDAISKLALDMTRTALQTPEA